MSEAQQIILKGLEEPRKEEYYPIVVKVLTQYRNKKIALENLMRQKEMGFELVFPTCIASYRLLEGDPGYSPYNSYTEKTVENKLVNKPEILDLRIEQLSLWLELVERSLNNLNDFERKIIEAKYLQKEKKKDMAIYHDLNLSKDVYYKIKDFAIRKIATSLNII
ncbi:MAG: hypothetical protein H0Z33_11075 [Bacillaceae bacterium]|nr:hypothetical protein [Bacillaceae bacterium]